MPSSYEGDTRSDPSTLPCHPRSYGGRPNPPTLDLGTIASAEAVVVGERQSPYSASVEDVGVVLGGHAMASREDWLAVFLRKFFPSRTLESIIDGPHIQYRLTKGPAEEDVSDVVLAYLLTPKSVHKRGVLPCPKQFAGLAYSTSTEHEWRAGLDYLVLTTMANPFLYTYPPPGIRSVARVELPHVEGYVRWLAKQRAESEAHIAEQLLEFIRHVDKLMEDVWQASKHYDLKIVESDLLRIIK